MNAPLNDETLRGAYAHRVHEKGSHRPDCPSPDQILAALRRQGTEAERLDVLDRALKCPECRRELALLDAVSDGGSTEAGGARIHRWRRFVPLALAATVLLAVGIVGPWRDRAEPLRSGESGGPALIAPDDASPFTTGQVTFVWRPLAGAVRYTVEIIGADGAVLFAAVTADTTLTSRVDTIPNGEHSWSVRARRDDGTEVRSDLRALRLQ